MFVYTFAMERKLDGMQRNERLKAEIWGDND